MMPTTYYQGRLNFRNFCAAFLVATLFAPTSLFAATSIWQGPYVGAYLGGGVGNNQMSTDAGVLSSSSYFTSAADISAVSSAGSWTRHPLSLNVGVQAGHDWVSKQMVYGVVADFGTLPLSASESATQVYADNSSSYTMSTSVSTNWLFTLRGRVGYQAALRWPSLFYVTGGMALSQLKVNNRFSDNSSYVGMGGTTTAENQIGWTAGVGAEFAAFPHVSVAVEYLYVHLPSVRAASSVANTQGGFGVPAQSLNSTFSSVGTLYASVIKVGLNYRFDEA